MPNLKIIIASTRPGRKGPALGSWIFEKAKNYGGFDVKLLDLAEINLPFLDEPNHPRLKKYEKEHTKLWSQEIDSADAFIFVMPEYNFGYSATIKNAIDFLFNEWAYKPVAFVSYGGLAAGTRAVQMLVPIVSYLKMIPITEGVNVPFFTKYINAEGIFVPEEIVEKSALTMLNELLKWANMVKEMRKD